MKGTDIRSLLPLAGPVMQNAGRIQRPPLHARLLAEIKSLAICWEAKTSLSAGASSLEQALMWQSLSTIYSLGRSLCSSRVFQGTVHSSAECRVQQLPARSAAAQVPHHNPEQSCNIGESKISALKDSNIHEKVGRAFPGWHRAARASCAAGSSTHGSQKRWKAPHGALWRNTLHSSSKSGRITMKYKSWVWGFANWPTVSKSCSISIAPSPPNPTEVSTKINCRRN